MDPIPNYYAALGISVAATADDVRKAYRQKVLETHPDKLGPDASEQEKQEAEDQFRRVREAFEVLGNVDQRRAYDIHTRNLPHPTPATSPAPSGASRASSFNWDTKSTHSTHSDSSSQSTYAAPSSMPSIETIRRSAEREAWAQLGHIRSQQRLRALKEGQGRKQLQEDTKSEKALEVRRDEEKEEKKLQVEKVQEVKQETKVKKEEEYKVLVETMVQEIYKLSPEWEARKLRLEQMKASRPSVSRNASSKSIWTLAS